MATHRDSQKRKRSQTARADDSATRPGKPSAQIIRFKVDPARRRHAAKATPSPQVASLLAVLRTEVAIAIGISQGLGETLSRFQGYLSAIDNEIARGEVLQLQATIRKQTVHLRATVLAASADLRRVLPNAPAAPVSDARSDLIYS